MIERIAKNEARLDNVLVSIKNLEKALTAFKQTKKDLILLNKYYGSKNWLIDKEKYENNKLPKTKAGVLSEDAVWNMLEDIKDLIKKMEKTTIEYSKL